MKSKKSDFNFKDIPELPSDERKEVQRWIIHLSRVEKPIKESIANIARHLVARWALSEENMTFGKTMKIGAIL